MTRRMNFHFFFDPETQSHLPLVDRFPWLIYPGVLVAEVGAEMASRNVETSIDHWLLTITRLATAVVSVMGAWKSIQWAAAALADQHEAERKKKHHHK